MRSYAGTNGGKLRNVIMHSHGLGFSGDFCVSLARSICNVWYYIFSGTCQSIRHHFERFVDTSINKTNTSKSLAWKDRQFGRKKTNFCMKYCEVYMLHSCVCVFSSTFIFYQSDSCTLSTNKYNFCRKQN